MLVKLSLALSLTVPWPAFAASTSVGEGTGSAAPQLITSPSINPAAQQGKSSQSGGSAMNMMAGIAMLAACMATQPPNIAMCMMGAMAMAQGGEDKDAAGQSGATQMATSTTGAMGTNAAGTTGTNADGTSSDLGNASLPSYQAIDNTTASLKDKDAAKAGLQALSDAGYKTTPNGIQSSSGSTIPASAFNSSGGMIAAGLDPNQSKDAQALAAKVNDDLAKYKGQATVAEGGGGPGGGTSTGDSSSSGESSRKPTNFVNPFALSDRDKISMVAGKTVTFDGEPIGVKGDNIFEMVHVAYQRKTAGKHFIETDHDPELNSVRAPASLTKTLPKLAPLPRK